MTCLESDFCPSTDLVVNLSLMSCLYYYKYVIVNNGSSDRSGEIAHYYARLDPRIRVHDNLEVLNAVDNWNFALRQMSG